MNKFYKHNCPPHYTEAKRIRAINNDDNRSSNHINDCCISR